MGKVVEEEYTYPNTTPARTTLTDKGAGYGEPSEAALAFAEKVQKACLLDVNLYDLLQHDVARLLDEYAQKAVEAWKRDAMEALEQQKIPPPETPRIKHYNLTLDDAIGIIRKM